MKILSNNEWNEEIKGIITYYFNILPSYLSKVN